MRKIKFRAWDTEHKEMVYFPTLGCIFDADTFGGELMLGSPERIFGYEVVNYFIEKDYELMQYTGLKDKNGVEIYEGDIYKRKDIVGEIVLEPLLAFVSNSFSDGFLCIDDGDIEKDPDEDYSYYMPDVEIIGNKFENPELLEEK